MKNQRDKNRNYRSIYTRETFDLDKDYKLPKIRPYVPPEMITSSQIHTINRYLVGNTGNWWVHLTKHVGHALDIKIYNIQELTRKQADGVISYCRNYSHHYQEDRSIVQASNKTQSNNQDSCVDIWEGL